MAQFYQPKKKPKSQAHLSLNIDSLDHEGRGIARHQGKVCFVKGALPGEQVSARVVSEKTRYVEAVAEKITRASTSRVASFCPHYEKCGGCQLQHLNPDDQLVYKQQAVGQLFAKFAGVDEMPWQAPLVFSQQHYRRSARLAVYHDKNRKNTLLGYRAAGSKKIVPVEQCEVLVEDFDNLFAVFNGLFASHPALASVSHLQLVSADNGAYIVIRHTRTVPDKVRENVESVCAQHQWSVAWQHKELEFSGAADPEPYYDIKPLELRFYFGLNNFIQVNADVNQAMLMQAIDWLALRGDEQVLDLFCGIGNFSLALAAKAQQVVGVEGVESAVAMARRNAHYNKLSNTAFYCHDLTEELHSATWFSPQLDVLVLDPSRTGAEEILSRLPLKQFKRILYVSCDPVTLARDSKYILEAGFTMEKAGLMNMFPHTGHIETMALFERR